MIDSNKKLKIVKLNSNWLKKIYGLPLWIWFVIHQDQSSYKIYIYWVDITPPPIPKWIKGRVQFVTKNDLNQNNHQLVDPRQIHYKGIDLFTKNTAANIRQSLRTVNDTLISKYINRYISLRITPFFLHLHCSPNFVTTICLIFGIIAVSLISTGNYLAGIFGAILFNFRSILDGCDGEIARVTKRFTKFGAKYDIIADEIGNNLLLWGMYFADPIHLMPIHSAILFMSMVNILSIFSIIAQFQGINKTFHSSNRMLYWLSLLFRNDMIALLTIPIAILQLFEWAWWMLFIGMLIVGLYYAFILFFKYSRKQ